MRALGVYAYQGAPNESREAPGRGGARRRLAAEPASSGAVHSPCSTPLPWFDRSPGMIGASLAKVLRCLSRLTGPDAADAAEEVRGAALELSGLVRLPSGDDGLTPCHEGHAETSVRPDARSGG